MRHHTLCKYLLLSAAVCYTTFGFSQITATQNSINNLKIPEPALGNGYSNDNDQPIGAACLNAAAPTITGSNAGIVDLSTYYNLKTIENQLNIWGDVHVEVGMFSKDLSAEFMHYTENDNLSETLIYRTSLQFKGSEYTVPTSGPLLNSTGQAHASDPDDFRQACGDAYISQTHNGAYLYIFYQLHFLRTIDKTQFDTAFSDKINDFASLTVALQDEITKMHIKGGIHIFAYQTGGNPTYLSTIFQSSDPSAPTPLSECTFDDLTACNMVMTNIINYVTPTYPNSFPNQFSYTPDGSAPANAAIIGIEQLSYDELIPSLHSNSQLTPAITSARDKLGTMLAQTQTYLQRAQYLQPNLPQTYNYEAFQQNLATQINNLQDNEDILQDAGSSCFDDLKDCLTTAWTAFRTLKPVDPNAINAPTTLDIVTTVSGQPTVEQLWVAVDTTNPQKQTFRGLETSPTSGAMPTNLLINISNSDIYITQTDPNTGAIIASYIGGEDSENQYSGTVSYPNGQQGNWTATLTPTDPLQVTK